MNTIYFTKRFDSGILKGIAVKAQWTADRTPEQMARRIRKGKRGMDVITGARWTVTDASFQSYAR